MFLPRLLDGELPYRSGRSRAPVDEERRLLYVGITRAKRYLFATWPADGRGGRSPFVDELTWQPTHTIPASPSRLAGPAGRATVPRADPVFDALKRWRRERSERDGVSAFVVFHDSTLAEIVGHRPGVDVRADHCRVAVDGDRPNVSYRPGSGATSLAWKVHVVPDRTNTYADPASVSPLGESSNTAPMSRDM